MTMSKSSRPRLVKVTANLTSTADTALTQLANGQGSNRTEALNRALRLAALLHEMAPQGHFNIILADGSEKSIYLI